MLGTNKGKKLDQYVTDYVVFDLETTGISCYNDQVVEISAVKVSKGQVVEEFTSLVNPKCPIPYRASMVNGITDEMVKDAPAFDKVLADFLGFIGDQVLVGHNIHTFDMKFIYRDCEKFWGKVPENNYVDTLSLARMCLAELGHYKLTDLSEYYGVSTKGAHRALNDCRMNQIIYERLGGEMEKRKNDIKQCPKCGQFLLKRKGKFGYFLGCGGYPACRYTENL
ncbi:MAG: topoisomerase DNA-binding C4 zinc finger domain-containing protein [Lachnospiraceae bacterium]|nr:topoisomerase DNA-binding C4 zinc finger domain-containing protein [Lachnospiraceae bacterium]